MGADEDDIDVEAILARAAALREKANDMDALMAEAAEARAEAPKTRQTLVPARTDLLAEPRSESESVTLLPEPEPPRDPFAEVEAVLAKAREARGLPPEEPEPAPVPGQRSRDPFAAAEAALAKAREARAPRTIGKRVEVAMAEAQLRKLKKAAKEEEED